MVFELFKEHGFLLFRLKEAIESSEFLIYEIDKKKYYQYSMRRGKDLLKLLIEKQGNRTLREMFLYLGLIDEKSKYSEIESLFERYLINEIQIIDNIDYKPVDKLIIEKHGCQYFNIYRKSKLLLKDIESKPYPLIKKILMNLTNNDEQSYIYFIKWLAFQVQNPLNKLATSIVFKGEQGSGKTLLCNYILKPIFEENFIEIGQLDLNKDYNDYILGKQLVIANEVFFADKKHSNEKLKNYVSDDFVNINRKYKDSLFVKNYSHWIFTSNNQMPLKIERGDRRFSVFSSKKLEEGVKIFLEFKSSVKDELEGFLYDLKTMEVQLNEVNYPFDNQTRKEVIDAGLNSVESFIESINDVGGILNLHSDIGKSEVMTNSPSFIESGEIEYITLDSFYQLYKIFCRHVGFRNQYGRNGFTSMLKHLGFEIRVVKDIERKSYRALKLEEGIQK